MGKVQFGFASLVGVIGSCVAGLGLLGGIGILLFHGGHWLVEGETVSILINDILPTPQLYQSVSVGHYYSQYLIPQIFF